MPHPLLPAISFTHKSPYRNVSTPYLGGSKDPPPIVLSSLPFEEIEIGSKHVFTDKKTGQKKHYKVEKKKSDGCLSVTSISTNPSPRSSIDLNRHDSLVHNSADNTRLNDPSEEALIEDRFIGRKIPDCNPLGFPDEANTVISNIQRAHMAYLEALIKGERSEKSPQAVMQPDEREARLGSPLNLHRQASGADYDCFEDETGKTIFVNKKDRNQYQEFPASVVSMRQPLDLDQQSFFEYDGKTYIKGANNDYQTVSYQSISPKASRESEYSYYDDGNGGTVAIKKYDDGNGGTVAIKKKDRSYQEYAAPHQEGYTRPESAAFNENNAALPIQGAPLTTSQAPNYSSFRERLHASKRPSKISLRNAIHAALNFLESPRQN